MGMNQYQAKAQMLRHQLNLQNAADGGNPYHAMHITDFCDYADSVVAAAMEDLRRELTVMVRQELKSGKVQVGIDEGAFRKAKSKIDSLFKDIGRFIR